ncbi:MAG: hypothetical protein HY300_04205 [Verrucomicrobia bacterium]|nr:hypothetical protein [Verrucomicrobiota bacterium]
MKHDYIKQFVSLRNSLVQERTQIESRLEEINRALSQGEPTATPSSGASPYRKRMISAAGRARIAAAQKARWAKIKAGNKQSSKPAAKKAKRTLSAGARAKIAAAQRARWAKVKAAKAA